MHDGYGGAIWHLSEALLRAPKVSEALRATLTAVRERFIPELAELKRSHADEAAAAARREPELAAMKAELKAIPTPDGRTLYDWCAGYLRAGKELDGLLQRRADVAPADRSGLGTLRGRCVGMLNRFRAALADETRRRRFAGRRRRCGALRLPRRAGGEARRRGRRDGGREARGARRADEALQRPGARYAPERCPADELTARRLTPPSSSMPLSLPCRRPPKLPRSPTR